MKELKILNTLNSLNWELVKFMLDQYNEYDFPARLAKYIRKMGIEDAACSVGETLYGLTIWHPLEDLRVQCKRDEIPYSEELEKEFFIEAIISSRKAVSSFFDAVTNCYEEI